jgi:hypothetical protein
MNDGEWPNLAGSAYLQTLDETRRHRGLANLLRSNLLICEARQSLNAENATCRPEVSVLCVSRSLGPTHRISPRKVDERSRGGP